MKGEGEGENSEHICKLKGEGDGEDSELDKLKGEGDGENSEHDKLKKKARAKTASKSSWKKLAYSRAYHQAMSKYKDLEVEEKKAKAREVAAATVASMASKCP